MRCFARAPHPTVSRIGAAHVELVWSMWGGYWTRDKCAVREWAQRQAVEPQFIHSGGHAWPVDLARLRAALQPINLEVVHTAVA